jgi:glycosyltransferase involved in cell wall biosynthesis
VPIVATRVGGNIEVLRDNEDALLVNPDPSEIKEAVTRLLTQAELAKTLTINAYQRLIGNYDWDTIQRKYLTLYEQLLEVVT